MRASNGVSLTYFYEGVIVMESYATREATEAFLESLGFKRFESTSSGVVYYDSPGEDEFGTVVQLHLYECRNGYYCVDVDGGWRAPVIWNGPKADWDKKDTSEEFVAYLDRYFPGWR